jgi:hypothetical protein
MAHTNPRGFRATALMIMRPCYLPMFSGRTV